MALGKGLDALLGETTLQTQSGGSVNLPISQVEPGLNQPRKNFDEEALADLSESIRQHGILQPLTVRRLASGYYQIIAGERRWRAARMAGLTEVPAMIVEADDRKVMELGLIENLQREDLNPMEEAMGYRALMKDYGLTQEEVSQRVSKSRPTVSNAMRLLQLPQEVQWLIEQGSLSAGHGRAMLPLEDPDAEIAMAEEIMRKNLSVREVEDRIRRMRKEENAGGPSQRSGMDKNREDMYYRDAELRLTQDLGRKVTITPGRKKGKLTLEYYDAEDLNELLASLNAMSRHRSNAASRLGREGKKRS